MRNFLRLTLVSAIVLLACSANVSHAQKFAYIDAGALVDAMPESKDAQEKMKAYQEDARTMLESIQVEYNNKANDYQKNMSTLSENMRQLKEKELADLSGRFTDFQRSAQEDLQKKYEDLMNPIVEKAKTAIQTVAKAQGCTAVFDTSSGALLYQNDATMINLLPLVKKELGITDAPAASTPAKK